MKIVILVASAAFAALAGETSVVQPEKYVRDSADAAVSRFGDARWLYLDHEKSGCLSAIAWY